MSELIMTNIFTQNKTLRYLLYFTILTLVVSAVLRIITPPEPQIIQTSFATTDLNNLKTQFSQISFSGKKIEVPEELKVATLSFILDEDSVIQNIIDKYSLKINTNLQRYWTNNQGQSLHQDLYNKKYTLTIDNNFSTTKAVSLEKIIQKTDSEIKKNFPKLKLQLLPHKKSFLKKASEFNEKTTFDKADIITFSYSYFIDKFPIRFNKDADDPFLITSNKSGKIQSIVFSPFFISVQELPTKKTISIKKAIENINQNIGSVISFGFEDGYQSDISNISFADLDTVEIEYRYDKRLGLAYPFYRFSGEARDSNNKVITVEIITPAVQTLSR